MSVDNSVNTPTEWIWYPESLLGKMFTSPKRSLQWTANVALMRRKWENEETDKEAQDIFTRYVACASQGRLFKDFCYHLVSCGSKCFQKRVRFWSHSSLRTKVFVLGVSFCFPFLIPWAFFLLMSKFFPPKLWSYTGLSIFILHRNFINRSWNFLVSFYGSKLYNSVNWLKFTFRINLFFPAQISQPFCMCSYLWRPNSP